MSHENYIRVETRLIASLQRAGYTNDLGLLYIERIIFTERRTEN